MCVRVCVRVCIYVPVEDSYECVPGCVSVLLWKWNSVSFGVCPILMSMCSSALLSLTRA